MAQKKVTSAGLNHSVEAKRPLVEPEHPQLSIVRQCQLLGLWRSGWYYRAVGESAENLALMRLIDEQYTRTPFYGYRRITVWLHKQGHEVNKKRIARLMQAMGLCALFPKRKTSTPAPGHKVYPYLLRNVTIERVNQVWSTGCPLGEHVHPDAAGLYLSGGGHRLV